MLLLGSSLIYGLVSLVDHLNFRTAAFSLGITAQAVAAFVHGRMPWAMMLPDVPPMPFLAGYFSRASQPDTGAGG